MICAALAACRGLGGEPPIVATAPPPESTDDALAWRPDIANGARIYAERCVECHGESGDGRGELALAGNVERPLDMTDRAAVAVKSPLGWFEIITEGRIDKLMPPWEAALSEAERWDVTLYAYLLATTDELLAQGERLWRETCGECDLPPAVPPVYSDVDYGAKLNRDLFGSALSQPEAAAVAAYARMQSLAIGVDSGGASLPVGALRGRVEHGTAGGVLPSDTVAQLHYGNAEIGYRVAEAALGDNFAFRFEDLPFSTDISYVLGVMYNEGLFSRKLDSGDISGASDVVITVYDTTNDPLAVSVAQVDLTIEPVRLADMGAGLRVSQFLTVRNNSDRVYMSGRGFDDGREAALLIQFPLGARLISGDQAGRYVVIEDIERLPNSVIDTWPVLPGEVHALVLEYWLPYENELRFEQAFNNRMDAEVTVTLAGNLELASGWLLEIDGDYGNGNRVYHANLRMDGESEIGFSISGDPFLTSSDDDWVITSEALPALLIGALAAAGFFIAMGLAKRRGDRAGDIERLVKELARLEVDHDQGRINHDLYHHRRRELKAQLAEKMEANS